MDARKTKKIFFSAFISGLTMLVLMFILVPIWSSLFPGLEGEYTSGLYRSFDDPLMNYIFLHPFVLGLLMSFTYVLFNAFQKVKPLWMRGLKYGFVFWLMVVVPGMLMTYTAISADFISGTMVLSWTLDGLIRLLIGGIVTAYICERKW